MGYDDLTIVLPTLNEEENIGKIIEALVRAYRGISIIVADDGSSDSTKSVVKKLSSKNRRIVFLDRKMSKTKGLTASAIEGIEKSKTKYVIVMDADLQHPISAISQMKEKLEAGNDIVVAVREDVKDWELYRKMISRALIYLGYSLLVVRGKEVCSDIFSGYFGVKRNFFVKVQSSNRRRFVGEGYKILFDLLKCLDSRSVSIAEVPYTFNSRKAGRSKAGTKQFVALLKSFFS